MDAANLANVLGAFAMFIADEQNSAIRAAGHDQSSTLALIHLVKYPGATIDALRDPLSLTHSGCVRLVDRLAEIGLVERRAAADGRAVALHLTRSGREAVATAQRARSEALARALRVLTPHERQVLGKTMHKLLAGEVATTSTALRTCRLCDYDACADCPCEGAS